MRIISGEFRGRRLAAPKGFDTRPMLGRVREAVFSALGETFQDAKALDLFSGTGSLGIEMISRGASYVRFLERDRAAADVLLSNLSEFGVTERSDVRKADALDPRNWADSSGEPWADYVVMDPPYPFLRDPELRPRVFQAVIQLVNEILVADGILILHTHPRDVRADDPALDMGFDLARREYGNSAIFYIQKSQD
tara:strand:+ start:934 stop:1518 length:585 start_codon:yes stop_codon:yes gene_type:complete